MMTRPGLTLLETLMATILLAMIAAVCVPTLIQAVDALDAGPCSQASMELVEFSDLFCDDPEGFGGVDLRSIQGEADYDIRLPQQLGHNEKSPSVFVRLLRAEMADAPRSSEHVWVMFTHEGSRVFGWVAPGVPGQEAGAP